MMKAQSQKKSSKSIPLHPLLIAAASVILLLLVNKTEMEALAAVRLLVIVLLFTGLLLLLARLIFRNWQKAALAVTMTVILFSTYGHFFNILQSAETLSFITRHRYVSALYLVIFAVSIFFISHAKRTAALNGLVNLVAGFILVIPLIQVIAYYSTAAQQDQNHSAAANTEEPALTISKKSTPDIYYIILDSYTRDDQLYNDFSYDNSAFLDALRDRGFFVGDCSHSNYAHTKLSLSSSLNMDYLQNMGVNLDESTGEVVSFTELIEHSEVRKQLSALGYKTIAFETGYAFTEITDADYYFESSSNIFLSPFIEPFEYLFIQNSIVRIALDTQSAFVNRYLNPIVFPFTSQENRVQNVFTVLPDIPDIAGPKFVFVHLDIPHHPFIFMSDGSINPDNRYYPGVYMPDDLTLLKQGYVNQVKYVESEILPIVDEILTKSAQPPIIILQGDHGLTAGERNDILYAIYLPEGGIDQLYSTITPVNTFRVIFDEYFDGNYPLLDDLSYYSTYEDKLDLTPAIDKTERCGAQ